ncbi:amidohydrolase [Parasegetibacter sp. NRK P23]|uniref:amidohydrolase n=1 Tax=Parasegetibacter sp. NRK P23 TaxID=2942999 RepID=UPI0020435184|nr:amidohydrolase [Parasegetibacter sp. NRK P23]MCM5527253.1 amidohydrolase [Parasegetibacter sp. NRK P23]
MRKITSVFLLLLAIQGNAQEKGIRAKINAETDKVEQKVIAWRRDIHANPELGNQEFRTAEIIAKHLETLGIEVKRNVAKTGVVGILKGGLLGPVIALRADMDALPVTEKTGLPFASKATTTYNGQQTGVMHACGHDAHVAMLMGAAEVFAALRKELKGTIKFIFQPAEEGAPVGEEGGAALMVKEGVLENPRPDVIFGLHMDAQSEVGNIAYRPGGTMAGVNDLKITVKGKQAHGAYPWQGIDPVVTAAQIVTSLQTIVSRNLNVTENAGVVTIGTIHGGNRFNIIPEQVEMTGTLRFLSEADEKMIVQRIKDIAVKTGEAAGASVEVKIPYSNRYPVTYNDPVLMEKMLPSLRKTAGAEHIVLAVARTGAEDFSFYQEKVPGLFLFLGGMPKGKNKLEAPSHHTPEFFIDESGLKLGVLALVNLAFDYANQK